jgi:hypothetical protein
LANLASFLSSCLAHCGVKADCWAKQLAKLIQYRGILIQDNGFEFFTIMLTVV